MAAFIIGGKAPFAMAPAATGRMSWREVPGYIAAQVAGATLGAWAIVNPARTLGPMLIGQFFGGTVHRNQLWFYLSPEILAGIAAGFLSTALNARRTAVPASSVAVPSEGVPA